MQTNNLAIASYGYLGSEFHILTTLGISTEGFYGIYLFLQEGLLVHTIQLYEKNTINPIVGAILTKYCP